MSEKVAPIVYAADLIYEGPSVRAGFFHTEVSSEASFDHLPKGFTGAVLDHIRDLMDERANNTSFVELPAPRRAEMLAEATALSRVGIIS